MRRRMFPGVSPRPRSSSPSNDIATQSPGLFQTGQECVVTIEKSMRASCSIA